MKATEESQSFTEDSNEWKVIDITSAIRKQMFCFKCFILGYLIWLNNDTKIIDKNTFWDWKSQEKIKQWI